MSKPSVDHTNYGNNWVSDLWDLRLAERPQASSFIKYKYTYLYSPTTPGAGTQSTHQCPGCNCQIHVCALKSVWTLPSAYKEGYRVFPPVHMCVLAPLIREHAPSVVLRRRLHRLRASQHLYNKSPNLSRYTTQPGFTDAKHRAASGGGLAQGRNVSTDSYRCSTARWKQRSNMLSTQNAAQNHRFMFTSSMRLTWASYRWVNFTD